MAEGRWQTLRNSLVKEGLREWIVEEQTTEPLLDPVRCTAEGRMLRRTQTKQVWALEEKAENAESAPDRPMREAAGFPFRKTKFIHLRTAL